ncbi:MAG: hypothetical protein JWQ40_10 [Segetibacter sp.]|nr:hypothetical protein [Segetibacter sp.]
MSLRVRGGDLKEVFDALEEAFKAIGIDYYLIGAIARDIWYSGSDQIFRQTKDVDFAVLVGSKLEYEAVKQYLKENKNFQDTKGNSFVMLAPEGIQIDILPFGAIEIDDRVDVEGGGLTSIKVNGFMEVYLSGTEKIETETGHQFKVATLPSIVLLKLIAFDDRPEKRTKDARDVANILAHFFDLQAELIYNEHNDIFGNEDQTLEEISAIVIGRELKKICSTNQSLLERLRQILQNHIALKENSVFIRNMVAETDGTVENKIRLLQKVLASLYR